ncbi:MAG: hypothetical protein QM775_25595 [Pirellulales bacterium]
MALSVSIPTYLNRPNAIHSGFTVSHLSFGPQERGLDVQPLVDAYEALMPRTRLIPHRLCNRLKPPGRASARAAFCTPAGGHARQVRASQSS